MMINQNDYYDTYPIFIFKFYHIISSSSSSSS